MPASTSKRTVPALASATAGALALGSFSLALAAGLTVPDHVPIVVALTAQVTTLTGKVGDEFDFKTLKDQRLGALLVPAGTPGHGRLARVTAAHDRQNGTMALQADSLDLPSGTIFVNIDPTEPVRGELAKNGTHFEKLPPPSTGAVVEQPQRAGNIILEPGTSFTVLTTLPRATPAPLLTAAPSAAPSDAMAPAPSATKSP